MARVYQMSLFLLSLAFCLQLELVNARRGRGGVKGRGRGRGRNYRTGLTTRFGNRQVTYRTVEDYICNKKFSGCKIDYEPKHKQFVCKMDNAVGCQNPFRYQTIEECENDFQGVNICDSRKPCQNGGVCLNVKIGGNQTFKCECHNTGYTGETCGEACPSLSVLSQSKNMDFYSCITI